jgi:hypothetical protein
MGLSQPRLTDAESPRAGAGRTRAIRQTPSNDALAGVANDAREQVIQNTTAQHLARELVQALASPDRRGLTDTLEDIRSKIGDTPPTREAFHEAVKTMNFQIENGGGDNEAFARSARTVPRYLNKPL